MCACVSQFACMCEVGRGGDSCGVTIGEWMKDRVYMERAQRPCVTVTFAELCGSWEVCVCVCAALNRDCDR